MAVPSSTPSLAMWAGIECTVNRVGDQYFDQMQRSGHHDRMSDLDLIADLGVTALRYPVLWERHHEGDWQWADARLARLRELDIEPIVTLLHHGSGPLHTSLLDDEMPQLLAEFAAQVAKRYPWLTKFTPVNEILTTARFSALYGHWYPHASDEASFWRALTNQCKGTVLAMRAIRDVIPHAELVSTEDLGATYSTQRLAYQAAYDNERRWASMDLLCGQRDVVLGHDASWFTKNPCPPDIMGFNYYLTSERWLDDDLQRWPEWSQGGNGRHRYADVHAVLAGMNEGVGPLLDAAWQRFGLPLAITEAHLGCTREEQLRWLVEIYDTVTRKKQQGLDIRALTAWSAFGCFDWHCLVTRDEGFYEPGLFDIRGPTPRATALARAVKSLAHGERPQHPVLDGPGFWARTQEMH